MSNLADSCASFRVADWNSSVDSGMQASAVKALEHGSVLVFSNLPFALTREEQSYLRPDCVEPKTKSIKFSLAKQRLWGAAKKEENLEVAKAMMCRYAESAHSLITQLFPAYREYLVTGNTSFRPVEAEGRIQSKRHDDRLLHVDAFPSRPTGGARLLRVFTNVHPAQGMRVWRIGEPFIDVAKQFLPRIPNPNPMAAKLLNLVGITKSLRTPYDHYMLHLHDAMKLDDSYQATAACSTVNFSPGSSWIVFSDQVSHAAMSGQFAFEQTFMLPFEAQSEPATSPLRILEKLKGIKLN